MLADRIRVIAFRAASASLIVAGVAVGACRAVRASQALDASCGIYFMAMTKCEGKAPL